MSHPERQKLVVGIDVGSTTVKATVVDPERRTILWSDYQRHNTKQPECVLDFLVRIGEAFPDIAREDLRVFITGSGGGPIGPHIGAKFVQEVNAVTLAVETLHPDVGSVIELGGQDAKIIIFKVNEQTGENQALTSMNDKCASGTGATIDKCMIKVGMPQEDVARLAFDDSKLHHVAAKCGVFAETDIVNLVKSGIPSPEIMCSLADAIVMQNLAVLTRGNTLKHRVLLLGGPNTYLPFLQQCWRQRIPETWKARGHEYPRDVPLEELIFVPKNSQYYAAYGAVLYGLHEPKEVGLFKGTGALEAFIAHGRKAKLGAGAGPALATNAEELRAFREKYTIEPFSPARFEPGQTVRAAIGLDGGSTSSKAVLVGEDGRVLRKEYMLSKGNPLADMKEMLTALKTGVEADGARLEVLGFGATGYAADVLERSLEADVNIVETVAHMISAVHFCGDVDVVCDVGGQDIKVLFMQNGDIKNFRLSNQCSAGNGMLLQAMADQFGLSVRDYADTAFGATLSPKFSYGCAVFLDSDRVNFQKEGFNKEELLAGLALVLPKNIWQYVVQIPRMAELGRKFALQGGTQHNLAAVKAQVDYILERVPGAEVYVHPHTGEAGAIGAAMETLRVVKRRGRSSFIGLENAIHLEYTTRNGADTRCYFCANECSRTFIDTKTPEGGQTRYISGFSCEKGTVEDVDALKALNKSRQGLKKRYPNLVDTEASLTFKHFYDPAPLPAEGSPVSEVRHERGFFRTKTVPVRRPFRRSSAAAAARRSTLRIGIPKALNIWSTAPFFRVYLETLGIKLQHVVFSDDTTEERWLEGGKYGSIDPCHPSKVAQAHLHNLLFHHHSEDKPLHYVFFPCITHIETQLAGAMDSASCPIVAGAPKVMKAAFTKEIDFFRQRGITYRDPALTFTEPNLLKRRMFQAWAEALEITEDESDFACDQGWLALRELDRRMETLGRELLEDVEKHNGIALLMLGRPYHLDPGLNHNVMDEFQVLGYPVLSMRSIPKDPAWLARFFQDDLEKKRIDHVMSINDVWPENYSANSAQKVWAAKFAARHPNVAVLDLSSFKCGPDAPTYGLIDKIIGEAGTPYSALHDLDANKPTGSIKIRVKTYAHSLSLRRERLEDLADRRAELERRIEHKRIELLELRRSELGVLPSALATELAAARARMASYERQGVATEESPRNEGLVTIRKRQPDPLQHDQSA